MSEKTLCIIKPDAVQNNFVEEINNEKLIKQIKILKIPLRRGPFKEAIIHYKDVTPIFIRNNNENKFTKKISFGRRPTKSSRRKLEKFMGRNF